MRVPVAGELPVLIGGLVTVTGLNGYKCLVNFLVVLVCLVFAVQLNQINGAKADKKTDQAVQHRQWSGVEVTAGEKKVDSHG